ncbi:hypothetical protein BH09SUM1_BH09SUM1_24920 [soil metagenome]
MVQKPGKGCRLGDGPGVRRSSARQRKRANATRPNAPASGSCLREWSKERRLPTGRVGPAACLTQPLPAKAWSINPGASFSAEHRQVFGLVNVSAGAGFLLAVASQSFDQCLMTAVVFTYRCGAVPDLHRIPSFDGEGRAGLCQTDGEGNGSWRTERNAKENQAAAAYGAGVGVIVIGIGVPLTSFLRLALMFAAPSFTSAAPSLMASPASLPATFSFARRSRDSTSSLSS